MSETPTKPSTPVAPMSTVLVVDPDPRTRALLTQQLSSKDCTIVEAVDGLGAIRILGEREVRVLVTELYLRTNDDECLIHAVRRAKANRKTRIVAHTNRALAADRDWAMRAGADAYLIKPTRAERVRYVVARLCTTRGPNAAAPAERTGPIVRRDSLDAALNDVEAGKSAGTSSIVFGRTWWETLAEPQRAAFRKRAKKARVSLRSDSMLGNHFVEVRGPTRGDVGLSTERPESPYRR